MKSLRSYFKKPFKKLIRKYFLNKICRLEWFIILRKCQTIINKTDPNPYYVSTYRDSELWCWLHIPAWIYEMHKKGKHLNRVLDIGGAYGTLSLYCKEVFDCEIYMIDFTDIFLSKKLKKLYGINFSENNIELDAFPWSHKFDIIILTEVLEHFNYNAEKTMKKIRGLLSEDGVLFLTTPDASEWGKTTKYYKNLDSLPTPEETKTLIDDHVWQYNKLELFSLIAESGFIVDKLEYAPGLPNRHFNLQLRASHSL